MDAAADTPPEIVKPGYARFTRRVQGVAIDAIIIMAIFALALLIAVALKSDHVARILGAVFVVSYLLYEPLMVSLTGGTLGHRYCNLRVVDDATGGNVGFGKALARAIIKGALGWFAFIAMGLTRRHQAFHDLWTRSTVQIRDVAAARAFDYARERINFSDPAMPSRWRRIGVIAAHLAALLALYFAVQFSLLELGWLSEGCIDDDRCSSREITIGGAAALAWLAASVYCIIVGWQGRLWGARIVDPPAPSSPDAE
jgi:uncharacterized RDD family membrane protein YckC